MKKLNPTFKKFIDNCADYVIEKFWKIVVLFTVVFFIMVTLAVVLTWSKSVFEAILVVFLCGIMLPVELVSISSIVVVYLSQISNREGDEG